MLLETEVTSGLLGLLFYLHGFVAFAEPLIAFYDGRLLFEPLLTYHNYVMQFVFLTA